MGQQVLRNGVKIKGTLASGAGDPLLTRDSTTKDVGEISAGITILPENYIFVGNSSGFPVAVAVSGDLTNAGGNFQIASGAIVNADVNANAGIVFSKLAATSANRAIISDVNGFLSPSSVTSAELGYLSGTSSNIQTQINGKQATITGAASTITTLNVTANRAVISNGSGKIDISTTTSTEVGYLSGVTSSIQTQLNSKLGVSLVSPADGDMLYQTSGVYTNIPVGTNGQVLTVVAGLPAWQNGTSNGLPSGGTTNQYLRKNSNTNYDTVWDTLSLAKITDVTATATDVNLLTGLSATITSTEISYLDGVTSNIQSQLNNKLDNALAYNAMFVGNASNLPSQLAPGSSGDILTMIGGAPTWQTPTPPGNVSGVSPTVINTIVRWNDVLGTSIKGSNVTIDNSDNITGVTSLTTANQGAVILRELTASGTNAISLRAAGTLASDYTITLPDAAPGANTFLKYNGADYEWGSGGGGATVFTGLTDVPASYVGQANKLVSVKADESGLEFITSPAGTVTSVSGTSNRITSTGGTTPIIDIAATYVGQTSITTLGTVGTGTWQGTVIGTTYGGTGLSSIGTAAQLIRVNTGATALEYFTPTYISGNQTITLSGDVSGSGTTAITTTIGTNVVTDTKLRQSSGLSIVGRSTNTTGNVADIVATNDFEVLRRSGTSLGFGTISGSSLSGFTSGSVLFGSSGGGITQDNSNLFYDDTNNALGIGTNSITASTRVDIRGIGTTTTVALRISDSSNNQRLLFQDNGQFVQSVGSETATFQGNQIQFSNGATTGILGFVSGTKSFAYINKTLQTPGISFSANTSADTLAATLTGGSSVIYDARSINTGSMNSLQIKYRSSSTFGNGFNYNSLLISSDKSFDPSSGTGQYSVLAMSATFNATGTYSGNLRGVYYNPTVTSLASGVHIAFENTSGQIRLGGITQDDTKTQILAKDSGTNQVFWRDSSTLGGGSSSLTSTYIGYGSGANVLTGEAAFTYNASDNKMTIDRINYNAQSSAPVGSVVNGDLYYDSTVLDFRGRINGQWSNVTRPGSSSIDNTDSPYTILESERNYITRVDTTLGNVTIDLSVLGLSTNWTQTFINTGTGDLILNPGANTLNAVSTTCSTQYGWVTVSYAGSGVYYAAGALGSGGSGVSDGDYGDITVTTSGSVWTIDNNTVTLAKIQDVATASFVGRVTASTGDPEVLTGTQATTLLDTFTSSLKGLAPASGGGTTNFLRADGTWAAPSGGVSDGDKGDITVSSSGTVWTIDNSAVSYAKLQNAAGGTRIIGRSAASSGVHAEIVATADGQILRRSGGTLNFGAIDLADSDAVSTSILGVTNGGTGLATLATGRIPYGNGTSAFNSDSNFTYVSGTLSVGLTLASLGTQLNLSPGTNGILNVYASAWDSAFQVTEASGELIVEQADVSSSGVIGMTIRAVNGISTTTAGKKLTLKAGNAYTTTGNGNGGDVLIQSGLRRTAGSGTDGNITIDALTGHLILSNLPTSSAGLPTGAVWNNSGVLNII